MLKRLLTAVIGISIVGCGLFTAPEFPSAELTQFTPHANFQLWWELVEQCSGKTGRLADISWFRTTDAEKVLVEGKVYDGYWWEDGNRIAVVSSGDGQTVRHEMLHALLRDGEHPLEYFAGRCRGVVAYSAPEGYGVPIPERVAARTVSADAALSVKVARYPTKQSISKYAGTLAFAVTATNTLSRPVWVPLAYSEAAVAYDASGFGWSSRIDPTRVLFRAHQSRSVIVDGMLIDTGIVSTTAIYGNAFSLSTPIVIRP